jgi:hypothetical protein
VEVWRDNELVHVEHRAERPSYAEKRILECLYTELPPVLCEACGAEVRVGWRRSWAGRLICEECLTAAVEPCYRWRGW